MRAAANPRITGASPSQGSWELHIRCPQCGKPIGRLREDDVPPEFLLSCSLCYFQMLNVDGIWEALPHDRRDYFEKFSREYQAIREAEGRGSDSPEYYLALPYEDVSGRNAAQWLIRAKTFRYLERTVLPPIEACTKRRLNILDLGAGNGWMCYRFALQGHVPVAVDLSSAKLDGLGASIHYAGKLPGLFPRFQAELDRLPFASGQFDIAIFNASFHYSENYSRTLAEAIRCLRSGGSLIIADTPWYKRDASGQQMLAERRREFSQRFGFPSDAIASLEYLTDSRLRMLEREFALRWITYSPFYGLRWAMRPLLAKLKGKREPSRFRIYVAEVSK